jgi:Homeodomain
MDGIQSHHNNRSTISESLEQLAAASQRLADLAANAAGLDASIPMRDGNAPLENARRILLSIFEADSIDGYDGSEAMEKARVAHFNAALEMYAVMAENESQTSPSESSSRSTAESDDLASRIGQALLKELLDFYNSTLHGNDRVTFTTEQRTALESAFLLKQKLNTAEKRALARTCNLNPRQVEVWVGPLYNLTANYSFQIDEREKNVRSGE